MRDFWYHRPQDDFPPNSVVRPDEYDGAAHLNVVCTQTELAPYAQKKLVTAWCDFLPCTEGIKMLWFRSRVPQRLFDAACLTPGLEGLYLKWSGIKSLEALEHASELRYLHLGSSTGVESMEPLSAMTKLRWLSIENFKRISSLQPLESLTSLDGLSVCGSMWGTQGVETLAPVGELEQLRFLSIVNLRARDKTLVPLYPLRNLEAFHCALWWKQEELDELRRRNPKLVL